MPVKHTPVEQLRVKHRMDVVLALRDHTVAAGNAAAAVPPENALSRSALCELLGHSSTTMTKVIADLRGLGWVSESETQRLSDVGRPRTALRLHAGKCQVMAITIEPFALHWAVIGLDLEIVASGTQACLVFAQATGRTLRDLARLVQAWRMRARGATSDTLRAISIALPGMTDTQLRVTLFSRQLGWNNLDIATPLEAATGLPVLVHNNTRAMGFAEFRYLGLHENEPMLFVQARYGLGAALLNSARPSRHGHFGVSELGYLPLGRNRFAKTVPTDGTLVAVTNEAFLRRVLELPGADHGDGIDVLVEMERRRFAKDRTAVVLYRQTLDNLALGLGVAVDLLNPRIIVLGGIYALASAAFVAELGRRLASRAQKSGATAPRIQHSQLGRMGALQGAAMVGFDRLLRDAASYRPMHPALREAA